GVGRPGRLPPAGASLRHPQLTSVCAMDIGIGLPNTLPDTPGTLLVEWARRAEQRGFTGLATIDRLVYPNYDSLIALAAAAGTTTRIGLVTNILVAPLYRPAILAKAAASLDQVSNGRLTLRLAAGGRGGAFAAAHHALLNTGSPC